MSGAPTVLELGTLGGYSSIWFAHALQANSSSGKVTSIEIDPGRRDVALANLAHAGVHLPAEAEVLPKMRKESEAGRREAFDFVFVDADWENQWAYFDWGVKLCRGKGSVVYVDDVVRQLLESGVVGPQEREEGVVDFGGGGSDADGGG